MAEQLTILLHSSKTMRITPSNNPRQPLLIKQAHTLDGYLKTVSIDQLRTTMHISPQLAAKTHALIAQWSDTPPTPTRVIDSFIGDIYSGLRAGELSGSDQAYADTTLRILSGLYGVLRPFDTICPYRLEMGYALPSPQFANLYAFWGSTIADQLPKKGHVINVSSVEYTKAVLPFIDSVRVITPVFLTADPLSGVPTFRAVHAKIARGAFARWLITTRTTDPKRYNEFSDLGYHFDKARSTPAAPVFICTTFGGKGLSIRLRP